MTHRDSTDELEARQAALQDEAAAILAELEESAVFADFGAFVLTGSYVSGLMSWPELDVMLLVGPDFAPADVFGLLKRIVQLPGVVEMHYTDERGPRAPTDAKRDERYHATIGMDRVEAGEPVGTRGRPGTWQIDLSLWLHDDHANLTAWHEDLRNSITDEQRRAVLQIKDTWHRKSSYPYEVGGLEIYTAVIDADVRTPDGFSAWLAERGLPPT